MQLTPFTFTFGHMKMVLCNEGPCLHTQTQTRQTTAENPNPLKAQMQFQPLKRHKIANTKVHLETSCNDIAGWFLRPQVAFYTTRAAARRTQKRSAVIQSGTKSGTKVHTLNAFHDAFIIEPQFAVELCGLQEVRYKEEQHPKTALVGS